MPLPVSTKNVGLERFYGVELKAETLNERRVLVLVSEGVPELNHWLRPFDVELICEDVYHSPSWPVVQPIVVDLAFRRVSNSRYEGICQPLAY